MIVTEASTLPGSVPETGEGMLANMPGSWFSKLMENISPSPHVPALNNSIYLFLGHSFIETQSAKSYSASPFPQLPMSADCAYQDCSGILYAAFPFGIFNCISQLHAWKTHACKVALWKLNYNATLNLYMKTCCSYHHLVLWTFKYSV